MHSGLLYYFMMERRERGEKGTAQERKGRRAIWWGGKLEDEVSHLGRRFLALWLGHGGPGWTNHCREEK